MTGKVALRYQPSKQFTLRGAASTGFRAPGISQEFFSKVVTNVIAGVPVQVGIFPVNTRTQGVDFTAHLRVPNVGAGSLDWTAAVNWTKNQITQVDSLPPIFKGTGEAGLIDSVTWIGITEERPDWRGTLTGLYSVGQFHALARASYYGKFSSAQPGF